MKGIKTLAKLLSSTPSSTTMTTPEFDIDVWQSGGGGKGKPLSFDKSCYALYWSDLPSLEDMKPKKYDQTNDEKKTSDEPLVANETNKPKTVLKVDGYSFLGRMATYKYIIEHSLCNVGLPADATEEERSNLAKRVWGENLERHFLWGYAALLDWEDRSGRLAYVGECKTNNKNKDSSIATDSWWGYMNFCYSICILLGALDAGVLDPSIERIQLLDEHSNYLVRTDPIIRKTIKEWSIFWKDAVKPFVEKTLELQNNAETMNLPLDDPQHERLYDAMNEHEWAVHSSVFQWTVFDNASAHTSLSQRLLEELPKPERKFCIGFCKIVDLFAALNWRTDLTTTLENGPGFMPLEVLTNTVHPPPSTSCSKIEGYRRKTVMEMHNLCDTSDEALQTMASVWKRVGRWEAVRRDVGSMIHGLSHGNIFVKTKELCRFAIYLCLPANTWEALLWVGVAAATTATSTGLRVSRNSRKNK